jgi:mono/diheme cytochrome c family protein
MRNLRGRIIVLAGIVGLAMAAVAQQRSIQLPADNPASQLKSGPGEALTTRTCALCHSLDYMVHQPRLNSAQWEAEVRKMITVYGAPINDVDAKAISEYLAANYGSPAAASGR